MSARVVLLLIAVSPALLAAQQRDLSGNPGAKHLTGTAVVSGVVRAGGQNDAVVPRAIVTLTSGSVVRATLSGDDGRFSVEKLPAGTYSIGARKAGWLATTHGATRPGAAGVPVIVTAGARVEASLTMFRGAAITGVLRDALGEPVMGLPVIAIEARTGRAAPTATPTELATTDDRGTYRLYGLPPGEYFVVTSPPAGAGRTGMLSTFEVEAALAALTSRPAGAAPEGGDGGALPTSRAVHYAPLFHPGTPHLDQAVAVAVGPGDERTGVDISISPVPVGSLDARVVVDPSLRSGISMELLPAGRTASALASSIRGASAPLAGEWIFTSLPPGRYRVLARAAPGSAPSTQIVQTRMPDGSVRESIQRVIKPPSDYLYGLAEVDVQGDDRASVTLTLQSGGVISGQLRVDPASSAVLPDFSKVTIGLEHDGSPFASTSRSALLRDAISDVKADGSFELRGIGPGRFRLTASVPSESGARWRAASARVDGRDLLDDWLEFGPGLSLTGVTITLTDRSSGIDGVLHSASGQPSSAVSIVVVPVNPTLWRAGARRIAAARPRSDGHFTFDVPPGDYALAAVTDFDPLDLDQPAWLEQIARAGVKVTVAEGDRTKQDIRIK